MKQYAEQAGIQATPHVFRHQCITFLTKTSGLADAELQLITGHARRETLAIYQHVAVDGARRQVPGGNEGRGAVMARRLEIERGQTVKLYRWCGARLLSRRIG